MISSKLIALLQSFSKYDLNAFSKFIQSPYHNENRDLINLFEIINNHFRKTNSNGNNFDLLDKKLVWKKLYGTSKYADEQMRRLASDLTKKIYTFLSYKEFKKNTLEELIYLLPTINSLSLDKHFSGVIRQIESVQQKSNIKNADFHYHNFLLEYNKHTHQEVMSGKIKSSENLEMADYHLDCYYIGKKLKNYCDALGYSNMIAIKPQVNLFPSFLEFLAQSKFLEEPSIKVYFLIVHMLLEPENETHFKKLKKLLKKEISIFPKTEAKSLYIYLINYCIDTKINNGQSQYFFELFDIYKTVIESEVIFTNELLLPQDYKNIITVGLHIKEFDWSENFIQTYTQRLPKESQDNDLSYNLAKVYFHKKDYEKVIEQLREVEYKNLNYAMGGKLMLMKTYYELKEFNALSSLLDSYSIYLRRNKLISREIQQQLMNGIRFTRKLTSLAPYDKKGTQKVKLQIENCKALASKKWLLEKVAEFE